MSFQNTLLLFSVLLTALIAGLYYGWAVSVIPGIAKLSDGDYLRSMQSMNRAILNPWFFASFMGTGLVLVITCFYSYSHFSSTSFYFFLAAALLYIIGSFGLTLACNVPLNEKLDAYNLSSASEAELKQMRQVFEMPWNKYHLVRTITTIACLCCTILAIIKK